jgi:type VI secretion system protein
MPRFLGLDGRALRMTLTLLLALALSSTLISCGFGLRTRALFGGTVDLKVQVEDMANGNNPVAVDVLLVSDEDLLKQLLKMPAREWFDKRGQIKRDFPEGKGLQTWSWEWVPGQHIPPQMLPLEPKARAMLIFANYLSPGEHRARWDAHEGVRVTLLDKNFTVAPLK